MRDAECSQCTAINCLKGGRKYMYRDEQRVHMYDMNCQAYCLSPSSLNECEGQTIRHPGIGEEENLQMCIGKVNGTVDCPATDDLRSGIVSYTGRLNDATRWNSERQVAGKRWQCSRVFSQGGTLDSKLGAIGANRLRRGL